MLRYVIIGGEEKMTSRKGALLRKIKAADDAYYNKSNPIMTDKEYDSLRAEYIEKYGSEDLDYVPDTVSSEFEKYKHPIPLLSLGKIHNDDADIKKKLKNFLSKCNNIVLEPKIDGLTIAAVPSKNGSCKFVTRGRNGIEGEILPRFVPKYNGIGVNMSGQTVRGEAYITDENFTKILKEQDRLGLERFKNSRNAASGILRDTKKNIFLKYIDYMVYEIPGSDEKVNSQLLAIMNQTKFDCIWHVIQDNVNVDELISLIEKQYSVWSDKGVPLDGIVIKYNEENSYSKYGCTGHHPNNAIAWKATADEYETILNDITWQVGRNSVTPVAELEPVEIDGTIVSRATLHNLGFFNQLTPAKGDTVVICKSGEIIPKVLRITYRSDGEEFHMPGLCPSCRSELKVEGHIEKGRTVATLRCVSDFCRERIAQNIAYLGSKDVLDIPGLSIQTARKIMANAVNVDERVIFDLRLSDINKLPGFAEKSAEKLFNAIGDVTNKKYSIGTLFRACCVDGIGNTVGTILEKQYRYIDDIITALKTNDSNLQKLNGIGPKTIKVITSDSFIEKLEDLAMNIITVQELGDEDTVEKLAASGTNWVITGKFIIGDKHITRDELTQMIESIGGTVQNTIKSDTDYLLVANVNTASTKAQKAKKNGVQLVTYDFLQGLMMA